jgi:hypothetical protein
MLQEGSPNDKYDFLELHIQGWIDEANKVYQKCFPGKKARRLSDELQSALAAFDNDYNATVANGNLTAATSRSLRASSRKLQGFPLHDPRFFSDNTQPKVISTPYYDGTFHPYQFYIKANTEVRGTHIVFGSPPISSTPTT